MMRRRLISLRRVITSAIALVLVGCAAGTAPPVRPPGGAPLERVGLLPLENLADKPEAGDMVTRIVFGVLAGERRCEMVEPGDVEAGLREMRVRTSGMLTTDQAIKLAARLDARYLLTGTILECGMVKTPEGEVPSVGLSLRMLRGEDGRVIWNAMRVRTGDDRETVFGWGREVSLERLTERTLLEMMRRFPLSATAAVPDSGGHR